MKRLRPTVESLQNEIEASEIREAKMSRRGSDESLEDQRRGGGLTIRTSSQVVEVDEASLDSPSCNWVD